VDNLHTGDECQKYWRDRFADQLDDSMSRDWGISEDSPEFQTVKWFREGIKYAAIIVRWDFDDEVSDQP
jgi:hypothetical protein